MVHLGQKVETDNFEVEIVEWILMNRLLGIVVSSWEVIIKACNLKKLKQKRVSSIQKWCHRCQTRNLTFCSSTNVGQSLPEYYPEAMKKIKFNENWTRIMILVLPKL